MKDRIKVNFLGTNGWFVTETGHTTCVLIDSKDCYVILDAGTGIYKIDKYIKEQKPIFLFLSHFHLEHICGLHILNKFHFKQGMEICCFRGGKKYLTQLMQPPYTLAMDKLPFKVKIRELEEGSNNGFPFQLECQKIDHPGRTFGYRFEFSNKIISSCFDTGYCDSIIELSQNADLVIAECARKPGLKNTGWQHLNPEDAANVAKRASAKKLALLHFDAENYKTIDERLEAENRSKQIFENTIAAMDDMEIEI